MIEVLNIYRINYLITRICYKIKFRKSLYHRQQKLIMSKLRLVLWSLFLNMPEIFEKEILKLKYEAKMFSNVCSKATETVLYYYWCLCHCMLRSLITILTTCLSVSISTVSFICFVAGTLGINNLWIVVWLRAQAQRPEARANNESND